MAKEVVVTHEGYKKLEQELDTLRTVKRKEVAQKIKVARGYGDLSENAEYDAAKEEQAVVEARIADLEATLKVARIIDDSDLSHDTVSIGMRVRILPEGQKSRVHIGAGDVDLHHVDGLVLKPLHHCQVLLRRVAAHIHDDLCIKLLQIGDIPLAEQLNPRVLQADGVHHTAVHFRHTGRRVAAPGHVCHALCGHSSQTVQIHEF